jgi:hypothetical protein
MRPPHPAAIHDHKLARCQIRVEIVPAWQDEQPVNVVGRGLAGDEAPINNYRAKHAGSSCLTGKCLQTLHPARPPVAGLKSTESGAQLLHAAIVHTFGQNPGCAQRRNRHT